MNLQNYLQTQTKTRVTLLAVGLAVLTAGLDYWSGPQLSFTLFYFLPVALSAWFVGRGAAASLAFFCAILMALVTVLSPLGPHPLDVEIWNAAIRCGIFLVFALVLDKLKTAHATLETQVAERTASLSAEITKRQKAEATAKLQFAQVAMDKMLDAAYWVRADGRFVYANDAACQQLGYTRAELLEFGVPDIDADIPWEEWPTVWEDLSKSKHWIFEARHRAKNGNLLPVEMSVSFLENDGTGYLCGIARDLTARRQTEAALRDSEQKYRRLHESSRDAFVSVDMQGYILESNPAYQDLLGYSAAELRQLTYVDITPAKWHALEAQIVAEQLFPLGHSQIYEKEYRRKDGTIIPVELRTVLIRDDAGQTSGMWAIVRDITERKRTEAVLQETAARMAMFASATFEGIVESLAGRIVDCNEQFAQISGYSVAELKGMEIASLIAPEDRERVMEGIRLKREAGSEHTVICKDGTRITVESHGRQLGPNSPVRHTSLRDITRRTQAEAALRESENRLRLALQASNAGLWAWDVARNLSTWDDCYHRQYEFTLNDPVSFEAWISRIHPDDRPQLLEMIRALTEVGRGTEWNMEFRAMLPVAGERWMWGVGHVERDSAGRAVRFTGLNLDITSRKQAEATRRESAERLRAIVDNSLDLIYRRNVQTDRYDFISPSSLRTIGYSSDEMVGTSSQMALANVHPTDRPQLEAILHQAQTGSISAGSVEYRFRHKDGRYRWLSDRFSILKDPAGRPLYWLGVSRDVTLNKEMEQALRQNEDRLRRLLENSPDAVSIVDAKGQTLWTTAAATRLLGYSLAEFAQRPIYELVHPDDLEGYRKLQIQTLAEPGALVSGVTRLQHKDGSWRWIEGHATNLLAEPSIGGIVINYRDITERKQFAAALEDSELRYRALFEQAADAIVLFDPATLVFVDFNEEAHRRLGYTRAEFANLKIPDFEVLESAADVDRRVRNIPSDRPVEFKTQQRTKTGDILDISVHAKTIRLREQTLVLGVWRDVTERNRIQAALRDEREKLKLAVEGSQGVPWEIPIDPAQPVLATDTVNWSPGLTSFIGFCDDEFPNSVSAWFNRIHPDDLIALRANGQALIDGLAVSHNIEYRIRHKDGSWRWISSQRRLFRDPAGQPVRWSGIDWDITERKRIEAALQDEREKLELAVAGSDGAQWEIPLDPQQPGQLSDTLIASSRLKGFIGFRDDEFPNSVAAWFARIHPEDVAAVRAQSAAHQSGQVATYGVEYRIQHRDGSWRWIASHGRVFRDARGQAVRWCGIDWDITDHKRSEEALQKSEARFRQLAEAMPQGVWTRTASGEPEYINQNMLNYMGETKLDSLAETHQRVVHPDDLARVRAAWSQALATQTSYEVELRIRRRDGQYRWFLSRAVPLIDDRGAVIRWLGTSTDIEDHKQAEAVLRRSQTELEQLLEDRTQRLEQTLQWLQKIYDSSQDAIVVSEITGRIIEFNHAFETLLGYSAAEIRQLTFHQLTPPEFRELNQRIVDKVARTGETARFEKEYFRKDGTRVPVALTFWPIRDHTGKFTQLAAIVSDVTEQHRLQREILEVSEHERRRIGQDLHDSLCQMLTATTFAVGALEERLAQNNPPAAQSAHEIGELIRRANGEARNISRGLYPVELEAGGLVPALQRLADDLTRAGKVRCEFICDTDVLVANQMQALHIYRITQEAVANALRHGAATTIVIVLKLANDQVFLEVVNNGRDWPMELSEPGHSPGMGLTIMAYRARMIGGALQVCRGSPGGTMVELSFPVLRSS